MKTIVFKTILLASAFSVAGFAETLTVKVPFAFSAAGRSLPAGEYTFSEETTGVLVINGSAPGTSMLMLTRGGSAEAPAERTGVTFSDSKSLTCIKMPDGKKLEVIGSGK
jgi:hypothetical protein